MDKSGFGGFSVTSWLGKKSCSWFLVDKKCELYMDSQPQEDVSTWMHVKSVIKFGYLTLKQKQKNNPTAKQNLLHLQTCENSKTKTPT